MAFSVLDLFPNNFSAYAKMFFLSASKYNSACQTIVVGCLSAILSACCHIIHGISSPIQSTWWRTRQLNTESFGFGNPEYLCVCGQAVHSLPGLLPILSGIRSIANVPGQVTRHSCVLPMGKTKQTQRTTTRKTRPPNKQNHTKKKQTQPSTQTHQPHTDKKPKP